MGRGGRAHVRPHKYMYHNGLNLYTTDSVSLACLLDVDRADSSKEKCKHERCSSLLAQVNDRRYTKTTLVMKMD